MEKEKFLTDSEWAESIAAEDAMDRMRASKAFGGIDPTFQQHFCKGCGRPTTKYQDRLDGANNFEEQWDDLCGFCRSRRAADHEMEGQCQK